MTSRLREALAAPDSKGRYVRRLFSTIAERYDLITRLLSYGQDRRWKARVVTLSAARPGLRALDLACGTGDMLALPFGDEAFDLVTTGYGLRNVPDIARAIAEMRRVLKPAGVLLSLDFNRPANPIVRGVYLTYLTLVGSTLGVILHRDPDTYRYIPESIRRYPGAVEVNAMIGRAGFSNSEYLPVFGGLMAIHHARR